MDDERIQQSLLEAIHKFNESKDTRLMEDALTSEFLETLQDVLYKNDVPESEISRAIDSVYLDFRIKVPKVEYIGSYLEDVLG